MKSEIHLSGLQSSKVQVFSTSRIGPCACKLLLHENGLYKWLISTSRVRLSYPCWQQKLGFEAHVYISATPHASFLTPKLKKRVGPFSNLVPFCSPLTPFTNFSQSFWPYPTVKEKECVCYMIVMRKRNIHIIYTRKFKITTLPYFWCDKCEYWRKKCINMKVKKITIYNIKIVEKKLWS